MHTMLTGSSYRQQLFRRALRTLQVSGRRFRGGSVAQIDPLGHERLRAEAFIRAVFMNQHGAQVLDIAPQLLMCERAGLVQAAAGWRDAQQGPLYLEIYLDEAIEVTLARATQRPVRRDEIVEVANLAASRQGASIWLMRELAHVLAQRKFVWATFTATRAVQQMLARVRLPLLELATADPARLGAAAQHWGSYYANQPRVLACRLDSWVTLAELYA
ncbi:MAG: hypothetical protein HIU89_12060 [Proteobacteria bacterium]|nr:hypothetical protein [Pseudomonadota bacterium]